MNVLLMNYRQDEGEKGFNEMHDVKLCIKQLKEWKSWIITELDRVNVDGNNERMFLISSCSIRILRFRVTYINKVSTRNLAVKNMLFWTRIQPLKVEQEEERAQVLLRWCSRIMCCFNFLISGHTGTDVDGLEWSGTYFDGGGERSFWPRLWSRFCSSRDHICRFVIILVSDEPSPACVCVGW